MAAEKLKKIQAFISPENFERQSENYESENYDEEASLSVVR